MNARRIMKINLLRIQIKNCVRLVVRVGAHINRNRVFTAVSSFIMNTQILMFQHEMSYTLSMLQKYITQQMTRTQDCITRSSAASHTRYALLILAELKLAVQYLIFAACCVIYLLMQRNQNEELLNKCEILRTESNTRWINTVRITNSHFDHFSKIFFPEYDGNIHYLSSSKIALSCVEIDCGKKIE